MDSVGETDVVCTAMNAGVLDGLITVFHTERSADSLANLQNDLPVLCAEDKAALEARGPGCLEANPVAALLGLGSGFNPVNAGRYRPACAMRGPLLGPPRKAAPEVQRRPGFEHALLADGHAGVAPSLR